MRTIRMTLIEKSHFKQTGQLPTSLKKNIYRELVAENGEENVTSEMIDSVMTSAVNHYSGSVGGIQVTNSLNEENLTARQASEEASRVASSRTSYKMSTGSDGESTMVETQKSITLGS